MMMCMPKLVIQKVLLIVRTIWPQGLFMCESD